ncbi:hypothetical protein HDU96_010194 [Phlyctochytrium bullatum]|nr:hypothetical protein HDU96_010194 [Phlyctochytrium bullatum]
MASSGYTPPSFFSSLRNNSFSAGTGVTANGSNNSPMSTTTSSYSSTYTRRPSAPAPNSSTTYGSPSYSSSYSSSRAGPGTATSSPATNMAAGTSTSGVGINPRFNSLSRPAVGMNRSASPPPPVPAASSYASKPSMYGAAGGAYSTGSNKPLPPTQAPNSRRSVAFAAGVGGGAGGGSTMSGGRGYLTEVVEDQYGVKLEHLRASEVLSYFRDMSNSVMDRRRALVRLSAVEDEAEARLVFETHFVQMLEVPDVEWFLDSLSSSVRKLFMSTYLRSDHDVEKRLETLDGIRQLFFKFPDEVFGSQETLDGFAFAIGHSLKSEAFKAYFGKNPSLLDTKVVQTWRNLSIRLSLKRQIAHLCRSVHRETVRNVDASIPEDLAPHIRAKDFPKPQNMAECLDASRPPQFRRCAFALFFQQANSPPVMPLQKVAKGAKAGAPAATGGIAGTPAYHQSLKDLKSLSLRLLQDGDFLYFADQFLNALLATDPEIFAGVVAQSVRMSIMAGPGTNGNAPGFRSRQGSLTGSDSGSPTSAGGGSASVSQWAADVLNQLAYRATSHPPLLREQRSASALSRLFDLLHQGDPTRAALIQASAPWVDRFPQLPLQAQEVLVSVLTLRHPAHSRLQQMVVDYNLALSYHVEALTAIVQAEKERKRRKEEQAKAEAAREAARRKRQSNRFSVFGMSLDSAASTKKGFAFGLAPPAKDDRSSSSSSSSAMLDQMMVDMHLAMSYIIEAETLKIPGYLRHEQDTVDEHLALSYEIERETRKIEAAMEDHRRLQQATIDHHLALSYIIELETKKQYGDDGSSSSFGVRAAVGSSASSYSSFQRGGGSGGGFGGGRDREVEQLQSEIQMERVRREELEREVASLRKSASNSAYKSPAAPPPVTAYGMPGKMGLEKENSDLRGRIDRLENMMEGLFGILGVTVAPGR